MRRVLLGMVLLVGSGCCCQPSASTGWRFEVLKPPTLNGAALVQSGPSPLAVAGLGTGAVVHEVAAVGPACQAPVPSVTLEGLCRRLDAIERRLAAPIPEKLPMPKTTCE